MEARSVLRARFGYTAFRPGQEEVIASVLAGHDTLAVLPTGGGKSLCYQIPALLLTRLTIVLSPLISLMQDQVDALSRRGIGATFINSTLARGEIARRLALARSGAVKLLYVAPERFEFGITAELLRAAGVSLLAVDEAHCISEWGHDFRPSYLRIHLLRSHLGNPATIALTATATPRVRRDISNALRLRRPVVVVTGFDRPNLDYCVHPAGNRDAKDQALLKLVRGSSDSMIVYASTRRSVERLAALLRSAAVRAAAYHAGMNEVRRGDVQESFMTSKTRVIVATNAFGMGIDKPDVRLVIHHSMPGTLEAYYQEAGRAGRDGEPSRCVLLRTYTDRFTHEFFIRLRTPAPVTLQRVLGSLVAACGRDGFVDAGWFHSGTMRDLSLSSGELRSCLSLLVQRDHLEAVPASSSRVNVRLLATPERIARVLTCSGRELELACLRALWRAAGRKLERGALVNLALLPPVLQDGQLTRSLFKSLQAQQLVLVEDSGAGWRLKDLRDSGRPVANPDWSWLERRRTTETAKLDAMQTYAFHASCRREFLLRYFGDAYTRENCGGCDNCHRPLQKDQLTASIRRRKQALLQTWLRLRRPSERRQ